MRAHHCTALATALALVLPSQAQAKEIILDYKLPEVVVGFAVSHTITQCPDRPKNIDLMFDVMTAIKPVYGAGSKVRIDASGNLFVDRTVKLEYHPNGTLKSFNGTSTGQGGALVSAVIGIASFAVAAATGPGVALADAGAVKDADGAPTPDRHLVCRPEIVNALVGLQGAKKELEALRMRVQVEGATDELLERITQAEKAISDLRGKLTKTVEPKYWRPTADGDDWSSSMTADKLREWFTVESQDLLGKTLVKLGSDGLTVFNVEAKIDGSVASPEDRKIKNEAYRSLVYRSEPPSATVKLYPKDDSDRTDDLSDYEAVLLNRRYEATKAEAKVKVPQFGKRVEVPFDGSGIFGSRSVAASFAEDGSLLSIEYSNDGGAEAVAGVVTAIEGSASELRDARLNAIKRRIDVIEQEDTLEGLLDEKAPSDAADGADAGS